MSIVRDSVNFLASISNIVFGLLYIEIFEKKRNASKQIRLLLICLTFISFFIGTFVIDKIFVRSIVLLCILFMLSFYYDCTFLKRIYLLVSFFSFFCISEIITGMISMAVLKMTINEIRQSDILYIANIFASQFLIFMMVKIAGLYMRNKNKTLDKKTEIAMVLLMLPTVFAVLLMGEIVDSYSVERTILIGNALAYHGKQIINREKMNYGIVQKKQKRRCGWMRFRTIRNRPPASAVRNAPESARRVSMSQRQ